MSEHFAQFLSFVDGAGYITEFVNGARTARNLTASGCAVFRDVDSNGGCSALQYAPQTLIRSGSTVTCAVWDPLNLAQSAAPWYVDGIPYPGTAYGFYLTDITGLDGAHHTRAQTDLALGRGGAVFGRARSKARVCKVNVQLLAATAIDLEHMFRWMEQALLGCCGSKGGDVLFRRYCPDTTGYDAGAIENEAIHGVMTAGLTLARGGVLLEGPTWETSPIENAGCLIRLASFTLGFADPCLYVMDEGVGTSAAVNVSSGSLATFLAGVSVGSYNDTYVGAPRNAWTSYAAFPPFAFTRPPTRSDYVGRSGAVVTIASAAQVVGGLQTLLPDMRIVTYLPISTSSLTDPAVARVVSMVVLSGIPSGVTVEVDLHRRSVRQTDSRNNVDWVDASSYLRRVDETSRWAATDCYTGFIRVEPFSIDQAASLYQANQMAPRFTVDVTPSVRFGCSC